MKMYEYGDWRFGFNQVNRCTLGGNLDGSQDRPRSYVENAIPLTDYRHNCTVMIYIQCVFRSECSGLLLCKNHGITRYYSWQPYYALQLLRSTPEYLLIQPSTSLCQTREFSGLRTHCRRH